MTRPHVARAVAGVAALVALLLLGGCANGSQRSTATAESARLSPGTSQAPITPSTASVGVPTRVSIPRIGVSSRLDRLALEQDGTLEKPPHWKVAGWYVGGPRPGDAGPAVIAGHVDSPTGPAVFARLSELRRGDVVQISDADGARQTFRVDRLVSAPKHDFPTAEVYGPTPDAQLRLITCDGGYDRARDGYQDNLVVFATRVPA